MKNTLKTIVYSFVAVALFGLSAQSVFAAPVFNNHPNDYPTILVSNYTENPGSNSDWSSSVSADAGDIVSVLVYYHNNGDENAISTKLKINNGQTLGSAYTHTISGSVSAANAFQVYDSASINLSSSQSLTYIAGSASWYPNNQSSTEYAFPFSQNGTEVFSVSGFNVGNIAPGWASQGSFVVQYQVSGNNQEPEEETDYPVVLTHNATNIDEDSAVLNGEVEYTGNDTVSSLKFRYGTSSNNLNYTVYANPSSTNNNGTDFDFQLNNLNDDTTYYFKACGTNDAGEDCGVTKSFTTDDEYEEEEEEENENIGVITLAAQNIEETSATLRGDILETNGEDLERYFEYGEDEDDLDETVYLSGQTDDEGTFSKTIYGLDEDTTYYFRACIESLDSNDEDCGVIKFFTTDEEENNDDDNDDDTACGVYENLGAVTTYATGITGSSAVLGGVSTNNTGNSTTSYFQYGKTTGLGTSVGSQQVSPCGTLYNSYNLTGLQANTTYYYRIVTGGVNGEIKSFKTGGNTSTVVITNTTTTTNTNTNTGGGAGIVYLALDITPDFENVYEGDSINFDVDYRNLYNGDLEDVVIHVRFPEELSFRKATQGFYSELDRALIVDLGDLEDDEEGTILIQVDVLGKLNNQDLVVTVAEGTFDHPTIENAQGSSLAHALNTILEDRSTLGASAFGAGIFPGVFGWLLLILILLLIIWISRKIYNEHQDRKNQKPTFQIN